MTPDPSLAVTPAAVPRADYIHAMRAVANSVSVVTTCGEAGIHGATASAFCSVSADPPTLLVCLHGQSRIAKILRNNATFCLNVLPASASHIADRFAGRHDEWVSHRFQDIEVEDDETVLAPVISGSTAFGCELKQTVLSGSHRIFIGQVVQLKQGLQDPLAWFDGGYHRLMPHQAVSASGTPEAAPASMVFSTGMNNG